MAYYCTALPAIMGTFNKNIMQHNDTVPYFAIFYKNLTKLPTMAYTPLTTPNFSKFIYSAELSKAASYRPASGQMWPRAAPAVTTRVVEVKTPNPTNTIYLYTTYGGF